jgi:hypothetical protein
MRAGHRIVAVAVAVNVNVNGDPERSRSLSILLKHEGARVLAPRSWWARATDPGPRS